MAISNLDYKLQPELKNVIADIVSRPNALSNRYAKADFGLNFWAEDYEIENYRWILERARIADKKIAEAHKNKLNVDDPEVLKEIAEEVRKIIREEKKGGSWINYAQYIIIPALIGIFLYFVFS